MYIKFSGVPLSIHQIKLNNSTKCLLFPEPHVLVNWGDIAKLRLLNKNSYFRKFIDVSISFNAWEILMFVFSNHLLFRELRLVQCEGLVKKLTDKKCWSTDRDGCTLALVQARAPTLFFIFLVPFLFIVLHQWSNNYMCCINYQILNSVYSISLKLTFQRELNY